MNPRKHAVLGAGPMGLICALELLKQGQSVDIYERDDRIGGMSATFDFDGLAIERYYHFICKTDQPLFDLLREVGIEDRLRWVDTKLGLFAMDDCMRGVRRWPFCASTRSAGSTSCAMSPM